MLNYRIISISEIMIGNEVDSYKMKPVEIGQFI